MKYDIPYMTTEAVSLLKSLISIPSISREETQAADFLQNYIEMAGMQTGRKGNNVWCFSPMFDLKKPTILLNSHIDTVKPVNGWRKDPFTPREENGKLYGLGSNDAGASVVSLLQVFLQLCRTSQKYNLIYLASCEEEVSGKDGIESVLQGLPPVAFAIVGEPTEMQPAIAEKGLMVLDVTATGKAGHAARNEGDNAIYKVLDDIAWFRDYRFEKESPLLGPVKMSISQPLTVEQLAENFFLSESYICRIFKQATGTTVGKYITARRISIAKAALSEGLSVNDAFEKSGFGDYSSFFKAFTKAVGVSPKKYANLSVS